MESTANQAVHVEVNAENIALVKLDMPTSSANVLTVDLFAELDQTFADLQQRKELRGLVLYSAKPNIFVAGADLKRINATLGWSDKEIVRFCEDGRAVMARLSQMAFPTVAAIHGACVGGGLEITLWCDYRIAANDRRTILGLPEVKLGLVPGWAGTVRLPRIANLETALDLITSGRVVKSHQGLEMGFIDAVVDKDELLPAAIDRIKNTSFESIKQIRDQVMLPVQTVGELEELEATYRDRVQSNREIHPFACKIVLEHLLRSSDQSHSEACSGESLAMAQVYGSEPSYGLLNHFFLGEHNKKNPGFVDLNVADRSLEAIGIVGAGLMGRSIARNCIVAGNKVVLLDASAEVLEIATSELSQLAEQEGVSCTTTSSYDDLRNCELVIESVVEVASVKSSVLKKISEAVSDSAVIATNTSAISIEKLSSAVKRPDRFCGVHFCHPELMLLVEVVKGSQSSPQTVANVTQWTRSLRKLPVVVGDCAGFVVNRLLAAMLDQAIRLLSWGVEIQTIDAAMRRFGFLGGPFEIVDVIGTEVCMYAGREMYDAGVQCVTLSPVLPRMVKRGLHGRRTGQGFYRYPTRDGERVWDPQINELLSLYVEPTTKSEPSDDEIVALICSVIVLEATRILEAGIVKNHQDIDLCIIHGFSFPQHVGGILFWADRYGISQINRILSELAEIDPKLTPTLRLQEMEDADSRFYHSDQN